MDNRGEKPVKPKRDMKPKGAKPVFEVIFHDGPKPDGAMKPKGVGVIEDPFQDPKNKPRDF